MAGTCGECLTLFSESQLLAHRHAALVFPVQDAVGPGSTLLLPWNPFENGRTGLQRRADIRPDNKGRCAAPTGACEACERRRSGPCLIASWVGPYRCQGGPTQVYGPYQLTNGSDYALVQAPRAIAWRLIETTSSGPLSSSVGCSVPCPVQFKLPAIPAGEFWH